MKSRGPGPRAGAGGPGLVIANSQEIGIRILEDRTSDVFSFAVSM